MDAHCHHRASPLADDPVLERNRSKTFWVLIICVLMMGAEIAGGYVSGSMALLADGFHMASHAGALMIALLAYGLASSERMSKHFSFGPGKIIPLGGYTSAIILAIVAILVISESIERLFSPMAISYGEAIFVAALGTVVNIVSALILGQGGHSHSHGGSHHDHDHPGHHDHPAHVHDHNIRSAFVHMLADVVTSLLAIVALVIARFTGLNWLDPAVGILGGIFILVWAYQLCKDTGWELMDGHSKTVNWEKLKSRIEGEGAKIVDFHVWRISPSSLACEMVVESHSSRNSSHFREILQNEFSIDHIIVETRHA